MLMVQLGRIMKKNGDGYTTKEIDIPFACEASINFDVDSAKKTINTAA